MSTPKKPFDPQTVELSEEEKARLRQEAAEEVKAELRAKLAVQYKNEARVMLARAWDPNEKLYPLKIELPLTTRTATPYIWIDGRQYNHGETYQIPLRVYHTIAEIMYRQYEQEAVRTGTRLEREYRKMSMTEIRPNSE